MVIFRSYTASVSYWLVPMYVEYSGIDFQYSSQHVHNVNHTVQLRNQQNEIFKIRDEQNIL